MRADELDFAAAGMLALAVWVSFSGLDVLIVMALTLAGALLVDRLSFALGIKSVPW
jgi:hypothetical protein